MINLIPPEGFKIMKNEHAFRMWGTFAFLFGGIFLILTIALVPTYILIGAQISTFALEIGQQSDKDNTAKKLKDEISRTKSLLTQFKTASVTPSVSIAIDEIHTISAGQIHFKAFAFSEPDKKGILLIRAQGVAPTRESLIKIKTALEASEMFEKAEIPISDLARDVDLPFVMTLSFVPKT